MGLPRLTLRQACHHFDGERVATVAVAVATTLGNRGDRELSAGERSDAQIRDKSVGSCSLAVFSHAIRTSQRACVCLAQQGIRTAGGVCLVDAMSVFN